MNGLNESMILLMPIFLCLAAVSSASETVYFGLTADDRWRLQRERPSASRVIEKLLEHPRRLLLTVLLGSVTANSLYFAVGTVALAATKWSVEVKFAVGIAEVIALIVLGEVLPKMLGNSLRFRIAPIIARPILLMCQVVTPIRAVIEWVVFVPLQRLTAPSVPPSGPTAEELREFVAVARVGGDISVEEEELLGRLLILRRARVRDVMTHRTEMFSLARRAPRSEVVRLARDSGLKRLPVYESTKDRIVGILDVRRYLLDSKGEDASFEPYMQTPVIVPEIAMLEQLFELFRTRKVSLAIVVDEFGGTAGVVALEDAIEEIVGDIVAPDEVAPNAPQQIDARTSRVDGKMSSRAFCAHFGVSIQLTRASTVGGIALEALEDLPKVGQSFEFGSLQLRVVEVDRGRARTLDVVRSTSDSDDPSGEHS